jgi:hypothetical protein
MISNEWEHLWENFPLPMKDSGFLGLMDFGIS